jgi:hypothetical protein
MSVFEVDAIVIGYAFGLTCWKVILGFISISCSCQLPVHNNFQHFALWVVFVFFGCFGSQTGYAGVTSSRKGKWDLRFFSPILIDFTLP